MRASFLIYRSFYDPIKHLQDEDLGRLFRAIFEYQINGITPAPDDSIYMAFQFFKNQFELDEAKYNEKCERNSENARMRWNANASERMQSSANDADKEKDNDKDKEEDNNMEIVFNVFWNTYGKKVDRVKCLKAYKKIPKGQRAFVQERARLYVQSTPDLKYRKNPLTWLNGKCWNDELPGDKQNVNGKYIPTI